MAFTSVSYPSFTSGTTASPSEVNQNFLDVINGISDGTKDIGVLAATFTGKVDANSTMDIAGALLASGTAGITGALTASSTASFAGAVFSESTLRVTGGATFSGAVAIASTLQSDGLATLSGGVKAAAGVNIGDLAPVAGDIGYNITYTETTSGFTGTVADNLFYRHSGKKRTLYFKITATSGVSDTCGIGIKSAAVSVDTTPAWNPIFTLDGSTYSIGMAQVTPGASAVVLYPFAGNNTHQSWTANAAREVYGQISYDVA